MAASPRPGRPSWPALLILLTVAACDRPAAHGGGRPPPAEPLVYAAPVERRTVLHRIEVVGTARAWRRARLRSPGAGEVVYTALQPDRPVAAGALLLRLDDRAQRVAVEQARLALADAERQHARLREAAAAGGVSQAELDAAALAVDRARLALEEAEVALSLRRLTAPFAGHLGMSDVEPGDWLSAGEMVVDLVDRSRLEIEFALPEGWLDRVAVGQTVSLRRFEAPDEGRSGLIEAVDALVDPTTRQFRLRARADNPDNRLRPGMSLHVIVERPGPERPAVAQSALQWGDDGPFVWRIEDGRVRRVAVVPVARQDGRVLLEGPLAPGDRVVAEGVQRLHDGLAVRVEDAP